MAQDDPLAGVDWEAPIRGVLEPQGTPQTEERPADAVYIFASLSLPDATWRNLMAQARAHRRPVVFTLRGYEEGGFRDLLTDLYRLSGENLEGLAFEIDPPSFDALDVSAVPAFLARNGNGVWKLVRGELALQAAIQAIDTHPHGATLGPVYPIEEPDLMLAMQTKIRQTDWDQQIAQARERAVRKMTLPVSALPQATASSTRFVDPTIKATQDLALPDGTKVVERGTRINPLEFVRLGRRYAIADLNDARQVEVLRRWSRQPGSLKVISLGPHQDPGVHALLEAEFGPIPVATAFILERLSVTQVPSLIEQDSNLLKVSVEKIHD